MAIFTANVPQSTRRTAKLIAFAAMMTALAIVGGERNVSAEAEIPDHLGAAKLRMTLDQAKAAFPNMSVVEASAANSNPPPPFAYAEGKLADQQLGDVKPCNCVLRFFKTRLINIECVCADKNALEAYLLKTYGSPATREPQGWDWPGAERGLSYGPGRGAITLSDKVGNAAFSMQLLMLTQQLNQPASGTPPAAGSTPAAPPAAGSTPAAPPH